MRAPVKMTAKFGAHRPPDGLREPRRPVQPALTMPLPLHGAFEDKAPRPGLALDYTHLAEALGSTIPVYGLRMPGLTELKGAGETLRAKASAYARWIREVQPRGPYALARDS